MKKKGMSVKFITQAAVIAAIYVVLVVIFNYISFGPVQFRIAEALTYCLTLHLQQSLDYLLAV